MLHVAVQSSPNVIIHDRPQHAASRPVQPQKRVSQPQTHDDLLWLATSRFCKTQRQSRLSSDQFSEAFNLLIGTVSADMKRAIAAVLADCPYTPRAIAIYLALEEIETATPFLARSTVLGQLDLIQVLQRKADTHGKIIAGRPDLGPSLVKHLKTLNQEDIDEALTNNYALPNAMAERSADALFDGLRQRHDDVDKRLSGKEGQTSVQTSNKTESLLKAASRGGRLSDQSTEPTAQTEKPFNFGIALERAAQARSRQAMAVLMQKQAGITLPTAHEVLDDKSGDTFAVIMRAYGVEDAQANRILLLAQPGIGLSVHNAMRAVRFYGALEQASCLEAVAQWPTEAQRKTVHAPALSDTGPSLRKQRVHTTASVHSVRWASQRKAG